MIWDNSMDKNEEYNNEFHGPYNDYILIKNIKFNL
jgi:hypothetical protein